MCGITLYAERGGTCKEEVHHSSSPDWLQALSRSNNRRGPDIACSFNVLLPPHALPPPATATAAAAAAAAAAVSPTSHRSSEANASLRSPLCARVVLSSAVLGTRAPLTPQPLISERFLLAWNGQVWQGLDALRNRGMEVQRRSKDPNLLRLDADNDGAALFLALHAALDSHRHELRHEVERDQAAGGNVGNVLASQLSIFDGPYALVLVDRIHSQVYFARDPLGRRSLLTNHAVALDEAGQESRSDTAAPLILCNASCTELAAAGIGLQEVPPQALWQVDLRDLNARPVQHKRDSIMTRPLVIKEMTNDQMEHRSSDESREAAVRTLHNVLKEAVRQRVESIHCAAQSDAPALALLYSGGLDSAVLAALTDVVYPSHQPIELLTVAFANPRKLASTRSKCVTEGHQAESRATFDTPDRLTARRGVQELRGINPQREWRLIEIDVEAQEYEDHKQDVMHLMYPSSSVMDLSIAAALYFASRGVGYLPSDGSESPTAPSTARTRYISQARVLLSGLGADEQLGGYSRHKAAWQRGGEAELAKEIQLDISRLPSRNLGRDDRVLSYWAREVRHPFLDRDVMRFLCSLPLQDKMDLAAPAGVGDKRILRAVAKSLGLRCASREVKRAIQFGARSAKMGLQDGRIKGHELLAGTS
ncbi:hypothetical protein IE81DRAFT_326514 [Ceraceosorus guamensis]|uniref:Asparagine synthetase domain-containing protein n=1 Tax=Ceraceosorus guamensis TaxID=1522189 RepID=A0A316VST7_9BASI|nr:hypothetical protein IE81DRAFT_326514 [Ceraceosorus guamensis]PWN39473.1 hypothetical protein IE81DRAFT_326514 [Ceraceosorus guamensis]